jgi:hypothetical protein
VIFHRRRLASISQQASEQFFTIVTTTSPICANTGGGRHSTDVFCKFGFETVSLQLISSGKQLGFVTISFSLRRGGGHLPVETGLRVRRIGTTDQVQSPSIQFPSPSWLGWRERDMTPRKGVQNYCREVRLLLCVELNSRSKFRTAKPSLML